MEPGFRKIIHPETGNIAEVPESSLSHHYRAGWAPLDESPEPDPEPDPEPVRAAAAAAEISSESTEGE
jgi:8-oxo-dGTP pyrophosphatase MutT (NUDIX family)